MHAGIPEGYKETPIGVIPEEWEIIKLGNKNHFKVIMGQSPSSSTYNARGNGLPFLQGNADFGFIYPHPSLYCSNPQKIAEENDILISVRAPVGEVNLSPEKVCIGRGLSAIRPKNGTSTRFYFHYLKSRLSDFNKLSSGSTFKAINKADIESYLVPFPPRPEQRKIAAILSSVDAAIQETDAIIAQTEQVKQGLMQELLTKGIGHTEFQETPVGRIPVGWTVVKLKICLEERKELSTPPHNERRYIGLEHFDSGASSFSRSDDGKDVKSNCSQFKKGDLLYGKLRPYLDKAAVSKFTGICSTEVVVFKVLGIMLSELLISHFHSTKFIQYTNKNSYGTKMPRTSAKIVGEFKVPLPPLSEQQKIAAILSSFDDRLEAEKEHRSRLETVKKGLMQILLTGKKRVKVDGHE